MKLLPVFVVVVVCSVVALDAWAKSPRQRGKEILEALSRVGLGDSGASEDVQRGKLQADLVAAFASVLELDRLLSTHPELSITLLLNSATEKTSEAASDVSEPAWLQCLRNPFSEDGLQNCEADLDRSLEVFHVDALSTNAALAGSALLWETLAKGTQMRLRLSDEGLVKMAVLLANLGDPAGSGGGAVAGLCDELESRKISSIPFRGKTLSLADFRSRLREIANLPRVPRFPDRKALTKNQFYEGVQYKRSFGADPVFPAGAGAGSFVYIDGTPDYQGDVVWVAKGDEVARVRGAVATSLAEGGDGTVVYTGQIPLTGVYAISSLTLDYKTREFGERQDFKLSNNQVPKVFGSGHSSHGGSLLAVSEDLYYGSAVHWLSSQMRQVWQSRYVSNRSTVIIPPARLPSGLYVAALSDSSVAWITSGNIYRQAKLSAINRNPKTGVENYEHEFNEYSLAAFRVIFSEDSFVTVSRAGGVARWYSGQTGAANHTYNFENEVEPDGVDVHPSGTVALLAGPVGRGVNEKKLVLLKKGKLQAERLVSTRYKYTLFVNESRLLLCSQTGDLVWLDQNLEVVDSVSLKGIEGIYRRPVVGRHGEIILSANQNRQLIYYPFLATSRDPHSGRLVAP